MLHTDLIKKMPVAIKSVVNGFKSSRGWFEKFKMRTGVLSITRHGECTSLDKAVSKICVSEFKDYLEAEGLIL